MRLKKGFVLREVCGEHVIMGEGLDAINFGKLLALNESAAWLWTTAKEMGDFTVDALALKLVETYDVNIEEAVNDVRNIINDWKEVDVIDD